MKKRIHQVIIGGEVMLLCMVVALLSTQAASANPPSNGVSYNKNGQVTVENALDNLYSKVNYGDAKANEILKGKKALVGGKEVVGTFTCPTLASLTPGNATPKDITDGKIAWVNGEKVVGIKGSTASFLRLGDYINYTPSGTSYTISSSDTGYKEDQIINPSELNLWRVIRKNDDGTIDVVSDKSSSEIVYFEGTRNKIGYNNYIGVLNKIAHAYETEGITVGSRHMGWDGKALEYLTESKMDEGYKIDTELVKTAIGTLNTKGTYWLASRHESDRGHCIYRGNLSYCEMITISAGYGRNIRPIIVLSADLKLAGGDGSISTPYVLEM